MHSMILTGLLTAWNMLIEGTLTAKILMSTVPVQPA